MKTFKELQLEKAPKMRQSTNPVEMISKELLQGFRGRIKQKGNTFTIDGFENGGKVKLVISGDKRDIFESTISKSDLKKAEKMLDDIMNSEDGGDLGVAIGDGDERQADKILSRRKIKGKSYDAIMQVMFGEV